jgi:chromosome segregation ATPase
VTAHTTITYERSDEHRLLIALGTKLTQMHGELSAQGDGIRNLVDWRKSIDARVDALEHKANRISATATDARKSISDAEASQALLSGALKDRHAELESFTKMATETAKAAETRADEALALLKAGSVTLVEGGKKQSSATRTVIVTAIIGLLGQAVNAYVHSNHDVAPQRVIITHEDTK